MPNTGRGTGSKSDSLLGTNIVGARGNQISRGKTNNSRGKINFKKYERKIDRLPSLTVLADWQVIEEIDLSQLLKLQANTPLTEDLTWCGHLDQYDESYDKLSSKNAKTLQRIENKV